MGAENGINQLCEKLNLGTPKEPPVALTGGLLHKMYLIKTESGPYVVKALNPQIMLRKTAIQNYINSERIALKAQEYVPSLPAKQFQNEFIHKVNSQYYIIFEWVNGASIFEKEIRKEHCQIMGEILAKLHAIDYSELTLKDLVDETVELVNWKCFLELSANIHRDWKTIFESNIEKLYMWNRKAHIAESMSNVKVISHRDLDPKNVLWEKMSPTLIDWEAAGYINPYQELIELAVYWSEDEQGRIDKDKFQIVISSYMHRHNIKHVDWTTILDRGYAGKIGWLAYNLKRALLIECNDQQEQQLGESEVLSTIEALNQYANKIPMLLNWIEELIV